MAKKNFYFCKTNVFCSFYWFVSLYKLTKNIIFKSILQKLLEKFKFVGYIINREICIVVEES